MTAREPSTTNAVKPVLRTGIRSDQQLLAAWVCGTLLLIFYLAVFLFGPPLVSDDKQRILELISALLAGFPAYFLTGTTISAIRVPFKHGAEMSVRASGGMAALAGILLWGQNSHPPLMPASKGAAQSVVLFDSSARSAVRRNGRPRVVMSPERQATLREVAKADIRYAAVVNRPGIAGASSV